MSASGRRLIELSHVIRDGLVTYPGLPAPVIEDHLSREGSRSQSAAQAGALSAPKHSRRTNYPAARCSS